MFGARKTIFGPKKGREWGEPTYSPNNQFSDKENIWVEGPVKKGFIEPDETGPTVYDKLIGEVEGVVSHTDDDMYTLQEQLINQEKEEQAKKMINRDKGSLGKMA